MVELTVVAAPMFAGKGEFIFRIIDQAKRAHQKILVFAPRTDTRVKARKEKGYITTRSGLNGKDKYRKYPAWRVTTLEEMIKLMQSDFFDVIIVDEGQFFKIKVLTKFAEGLLYHTNGFENVSYNIDLKIYIAGLDMDYAKNPFEVMSYLLAICDKPVKLSAICVKCRRPNVRAVLTQRISGGKDRIQVGDDEYEVRCRECHYIYK